MGGVWVKAIEGEHETAFFFFLYNPSQTADVPVVMLALQDETYFKCP